MLPARAPHPSAALPSAATRAPASPASPATSRLGPATCQSGPGRSQRAPGPGRSGGSGPGSWGSPPAPRRSALTRLPLDEPGRQPGGGGHPALGALLTPVLAPVPQLRVDEAPHEPGLGGTHQQQHAQPAGRRAGWARAEARPGPRSARPASPWGRTWLVPGSAPGAWRGRPGGGDRCGSSSCHTSTYLPGTCRPERGTCKLHIIGGGGGVGVGEVGCGSSEPRYDTAEIILED